MLYLRIFNYVPSWREVCRLEILMFIRFSTKEDREQIRELTMLCFGDRDHCNILENLHGRYILAFDDENVLLAMTGLIWSEEYKGYEVNWTCTHPDFQKKGIMHELFKRICSLVDQNIYCSCWRKSENENINLHGLMKDFGFQEVIRNRVTWDSCYNCKAGRDAFCVANKSHVENGKLIKVSCRCYEDLYLRKSLD